MLRSNENCCTMTVKDLKSPLILVLRMKQLILSLLLFAGHMAAALRAEPFERAEVTKTVNLVSLLPQDTRAVRGDVVTGNTGLKTGNDSRAELQFPDLTITRVGANGLFRFVAGTRQIILDSGTMLFSAPEGVGGGKVTAGAITAAVTGSDFLISNAGRVKVICLSHKVLVYFTANPKIRVALLPGQMLNIPVGEKKMPPVARINLKTLLATSKLGEAGDFGPLPSQTILANNASKQGTAFVPANASASVNDPAFSNGAAPANVNSTTQAAQTVRSTTVADNNPPSQSPPTAAATTGGGAAATAAGMASPPDTTGNGSGGPTAGNASATTSSLDTTSSGTVVNRANNGNRRNIENRGNSGNNANRRNIENRGNSGNNENRGNSGNRGNNSNIRNIENRGNSGNAPGRAGR